MLPKIEKSPKTCTLEHASINDPPFPKTNRLKTQYFSGRGRSNSPIEKRGALWVPDEYLKYSFYPYDLVSFSNVFMLNKFPNALKFHTYDQVIHLVELCKIGEKTATEAAIVF